MLLQIYKHFQIRFWGWIIPMKINWKSLMLSSLLLHISKLVYENISTKYIVFSRSTRKQNKPSCIIHSTVTCFVSAVTLVLLTVGQEAHGKCVWPWWWFRVIVTGWDFRSKHICLSTPKGWFPAQRLYRAFWPLVAHCFGFTAQLWWGSG